MVEHYYTITCILLTACQSDFRYSSPDLCALASLTLPTDNARIDVTRMSGRALVE